VGESGTGEHTSSSACRREKKIGREKETYFIAACFFNQGTELVVGLVVGHVFPKLLNLFIDVCHVLCACV